MLDNQRIDRAIAGAMAALLFTVYALGACRTIYVGDSGELTTAVGLLGIPHPSGYPLYVMLGHLWTRIVPVDSVAFAMSLFSAAAAALAAAALYLVCRANALERPASLLGALMLAFAPSFWSQANVQRVYTLGALFVVMATGLALRWHRDRRTTTLALAFLTCGLGTGNHTFMIVFAVALALFVIAVEPRRLLSPLPLAREAAIYALAFVAGLLPYLYLPIRSRMNPRLDWGNPETLETFLAVFLRRDFWERAYYEGPADLVPIALDYLGSLGEETLFVGVALALLGALAAARRSPLPLLAALVMAGNYFSMALHGSRSDLFIWHRYYIASYVMIAALAGLGWQQVARRIPPAAAWLVLALPAVLFVSGYRDFDRSRYRIAEDFSLAVMESLPPGAHISATDDNVLFAMMYLHFVERRRPDLDLILQGVGGSDLPALQFDPEDDPLFFTHHPNWDYPTLEILASGLVYRAWRRGTEPPPAVFPREELDGESDPRVPKDYLTQNLVGHFHYTLGFTFEKSDWLRARRRFERAAQAAPSNDVLFYNLGLVYHRNGLYDDAIDAFERSDEINPRHIASRSKPRASEKLAQMRAEKAAAESVEIELRSGQDGMPEQGSAAYHRRMAGLLDEADHRLGARGHSLRALEIEAGGR